MATKRQKRSSPDGNAPNGRAPASAPVLPSKAVLDALPEQVRTSVIEAASFSGPLPPPSMYGEYDRILSGSAERLLRMAEKEQNHRIETEKTALGATAGGSRLGQWMGFTMAIICIGAGVLLALKGQTLPACMVIGVSAIGLVRHFVSK